MKLVALVLCLIVVSPAAASWRLTASGRGAAKAKTMPAGATPSVSVPKPRTANVSWAASTFVGGSPVAAYLVKRYPSGGGAAAVACGGTVAGTSCTDSNVPAGIYQYTVTPRQNSWVGAESPKSAVVPIA